MSISQLDALEGPPDSAVQNRLTVAGMVLATLFFAGSFALQLHAQSKVARSFAETFAYLEVTMVVGALMAILSITCLLVCQQCIATDRTCYMSNRAWIAVATKAQYLSISQAMNAGLTELVFGVKYTFDAGFLALMLATVATFLWVVLLLIAPLHTLRSWWPHFTQVERAMVSVVYVLSLSFVLLSNAMIYEIQNGRARMSQSVFEALGRQLIQPSMWLNPWEKS